MKFISWTRELLRDVRYGARGLRRAPAFTVSTVLVLALGIGATTTVVSIIDGVLLRDLPYEHPERIAYLWQTFDRDWTRRVNVSMPELRDYEERTRALEAIGGFITTGTSLSDGEQPERVQLALVTRGFFDVLAVRPLLGRVFSAEEAALPFGVYGLLSERLWRRKFAADPTLIGRTILMGGRQITVVGIMPQSFAFPHDVDVWRPLVQTGSVLTDRSRRFVDVIVRIRPGFTLATATLDAHNAEQSNPENDVEGTKLIALKEELVGESRAVVLAVGGAVALVLLIACASVANLLLVRSASRSRETGVRAALGASRPQLVRQVLVESLLLSLSGALLGLVLAFWAVRAVALFGPRNVTRLDEIGIDPRVVWISVAVAVATAAIAGLGPAITQVRSGVAASLSGMRATSGSGAARLRLALVTLEIALSLSLLVGASLLVRTLANLRAVNLGFRHEQLLTMKIALPFAAYPEHTARVAFFDELLRRARALPGVVAAGATSILPMSAENASSSAMTEATINQGNFPEANVRSVSDGYLEALGVRLLDGRTFNERDGVAQGGVRATVINAALAARLWPGMRPLGKRVSVNAPPDRPEWREVVGVVDNIRQSSLDAPPRIELYEPHRQIGDGSMALVIRTRDRSDPISLVAPMRALVRDLDANLPLFDVHTMQEHLGNTIATRRFSAIVLSAFSMFALVLAALGLYGVVAYSVAQRTRELAVRMALGACQNDIARLVLRAGMTIGAAGVVLGTVMALGLTRLLGSLLFGIGGFDVWSYLGMSAMLLAVAASATWIPARRAARVDPVRALRAD